MQRAETYNDTVVRQFALMTVVWGIVGMLVGVIIAAQLLWPALNFDVPWLSYGRLRPLHTNAVIFAFGGSRCSPPPTTSCSGPATPAVRRPLAAFTFWGWQLIIVAGRDHAAARADEREGVRRARVADRHRDRRRVGGYGIVFFGTLVKRKVKHIYVANWFFAAYIITIAVLHIINSLAVPVSLTKSYSVYPGVVDAMVQWWYGHNAVGFFLTAGSSG
jgi:cytochrome c oxidase cbb3-type subunit I